MMFNPLEHSVIQAATSCSVQKYEATDFHAALLFYIAKEISLAHWNVFHQEWSAYDGDPHIDGIHWRAYRDECSCHNLEHDEACDLLTPHFNFDGVCFDWYKYPGRGMSVSSDMPPAEWVSWLERCLSTIRQFVLTKKQK